MEVRITSVDIRIRLANICIFISFCYCYYHLHSYVFVGFFLFIIIFLTFHSCSSHTKSPNSKVLHVHNFSVDNCEEKKKKMKNTNGYKNKFSCADSNIGCWMNILCYGNSRLRELDITFNFYFLYGNRVPDHEKYALKIHCKQQYANKMYDEGKKKYCMPVPHTRASLK